MARCPVSHPDKEQGIKATQIVNQYRREQEAMEKMARFSHLTNLKLEEEVIDAWFDPVTKKITRQD